MCRARVRHPASGDAPAPPHRPLEEVAAARLSTQASNSPTRQTSVRGARRIDAGKSGSSRASRHSVEREIRRCRAASEGRSRASALWVAVIGVPHGIAWTPSSPRRITPLRRPASAPQSTPGPDTVDPRTAHRTARPMAKGPPLGIAGARGGSLGRRRVARPSGPDPVVSDGKTARDGATGVQMVSSRCDRTRSASGTGVSDLASHEAARIRTHGHEPKCRGGVYPVQHAPVTSAAPPVSPLTRGGAGTPSAPLGPTPRGVDRSSETRRGRSRTGQRVRDRSDPPGRQPGDRTRIRANARHQKRWREPANGTGPSLRGVWRARSYPQAVGPGRSRDARPASERHFPHDAFAVSAVAVVWPASAATPNGLVLADRNVVGADETPPAHCSFGESSAARRSTLPARPRRAWPCAMARDPTGPVGAHLGGPGPTRYREAEALPRGALCGLVRPARRLGLDTATGRSAGHCDRIHEGRPADDRESLTRVPATRRKGTRLSTGAFSA